MTFDEFNKLSRTNLDRFEHNYKMMLDITPCISSYSIGFLFSLDDGEAIAEFSDMMNTIHPMVLFAGNEEMQSKLKSMGYASSLWPFFENDGFMLVLKPNL